MQYDILATGKQSAPQFTTGSCGYYPLDVTDRQAVKRIFQDFTPTVVINCAAKTHVDACETEREVCWDVNARAVTTLAQQCRIIGARLVQISTDFVFDGQQGPYEEKARPQPVNFYGKAKLAGENAARDCGLGKWTIIRTSVVFGTTPNNFVLWVIGALSTGKIISVFTDQWRTPTYVHDLAVGIEQAVRFGKAGIYHVSGREFLSMYAFAQLIAEAFDLDPSLILPTDSVKLNQEAVRPLRTGLLILKAETEIGFKPHSLPSALEHLRSRLNLPIIAP